MDSAELADRVAQLVEEHWHQHGVPVLLSHLGNADQGEVGRLAKGHSASLAAFIREYVAARVRIDSGTQNPLVMAAAPADIEQDIDVDGLLTSTGDPQARRFHPAFWAAFRVPLDEHHRRFVSTRLPIMFEDVASTREPQRMDCVEIGRQYIAGAEDEVGEVHRKLTDWLNDNDLDGRVYFATKKAALVLPRDDLLGRLLQSLDHDDLKRMTVPLDVIDKLRRQPA